jgi:RTX calcium-binding nonapeptide repeat (4 copies)
VVAFLIGCAVLLVAGASGVQAQDSKKEEARCEGTITTKNPVPGSGGGPYTTNDLPGCPDGGLLLGTDKNDRLHGKDGDDEIRALGGRDVIVGGVGNDAVYMGPGDDFIQPEDPRGGDDVIYGGSGDDFLQANKGADVMYGGDGSDDVFEARDGQRDKLYCGEGKDRYYAEKIDYVDSSCEKGKLVDTGGPPLLLLAGAALCSALMMLRYVIRSA